MPRKLHEDGKKHCFRCNQWLDLSSFNRNGRAWDGLQAHCRDCHTEMHFEKLGRPRLRGRQGLGRRRERDPAYGAELARNRHLRHEYGITYATKERMYTEQRGTCAMCGKAFSVDVLVVDHNHTSGQVRGLLCRPCNGFLGYIEQRPDIVVMAREYIAPYWTKE